MAGVTPAPPSTIQAGPRTPNADTVGMILNNSAKRYGVPDWVLWGVYGLESGWGKANNWFGLVSIPRSNYGVNADGTHYDSGGATTFSGDADIAAQALAGFYHSTGNWDAALSTYNVGKPTGGYNSAKILSVYNSRPTFINSQKPHDYYPLTPIQKVATGPVGDAAAAVQNALSVPEKFLALLTSLEFWLRLGEAIAGLVLVAMGLKSLTGVSIPTPYGRV